MSLTAPGKEEKPEKVKNASQRRGRKPEKKKRRGRAPNKTPPNERSARKGSPERKQAARSVRPSRTVQRQRPQGQAMVSRRVNLPQATGNPQKKEKGASLASRK